MYYLEKEENQIKVAEGKLGKDTEHNFLAEK